MQRFIITIIIYFYTVAFAFGQNNSLKTIREKYLKAIDNKQVCDQFLSTNFKVDSSLNSVKEAYNACAIILLAKHCNNPIKKIQYFNKGKDLLENILHKHPNNIEIRFLRYAVQTSVPKLLNYYSNISEDKNMVLQNLKNIKNDNDLIEKITNFLKSN